MCEGGGEAQLKFCCRSENEARMHNVTVDI